MILGTAAYMSPEQAKGKETDRRTDIWAFGCLLYEMLTGKQSFSGETIVEVLGGVVKTEPDWTALPETTPVLIRSLLRRCLQKDRNRRVHYIEDVRIEIEEALTSVDRGPIVIPDAPRHRERLAWASALGLVALVAAVAMMWDFRPVTAPPEMRLEITTPPTADLVSLAISPDGQKIVFVATSEGRSQLWLRALDSVFQPAVGRNRRRFVSLLGSG
jgi:hypothetical protein